MNPLNGTGDIANLTYQRRQIENLFEGKPDLRSATEAALRIVSEREPFEQPDRDAIRDFFLEAMDAKLAEAERAYQALALARAKAALAERARDLANA